MRTWKKKQPASSSREVNAGWMINLESKFVLPDC